VTFTDGPRRGEAERVRLTFLPDRVIVGASEIPVEREKLPPAAGEWSVDENHFSYFLNAVLSDAEGRPTMVVHAHADGTLGGDGHTLTATGGSEVYGPTGELLMRNGAGLHATRVETG
jgi:hypothetical protein